MTFLVLAGAFVIRTNLLGVLSAVSGLSGRLPYADTLMLFYGVWIDSASNYLALSRSPLAICFGAVSFPLRFDPLAGPIRHDDRSLHYGDANINLGVHGHCRALHRHAMSVLYR